MGSFIEPKLSSMQTSLAYNNPGNPVFKRHELVSIFFTTTKMRQMKRAKNIKTLASLISHGQK